MYLWNVDGLLSDLRENTVSSISEIGHLLAFIAASSIAFFLMDFSSAKHVEQTKIDEVLTLIITCIGVGFCYKANKEYDSKDFIKRFICLWLPTSLRFMVLFIIPLLLVLIAIEEFVGGWPREIQERWIENSRGIMLIEAIYYRYLYVAFKFLKPEEVPSQKELLFKEKTLIEEKEKTCQYCAETILKKAVVCKHCNRDLT